MNYLCLEDRAVRILSDGQPDVVAALDAPLHILTTDALLGAIEKALSKKDFAVQSVTVILSSAVAYIHAFETSQRRPTPAMLRYAFEEFLPVDIEQLSCDFVRVEGRTIGVALETARWRPLLDWLHERGVGVERIILDAFHCADPTAAALWVDADHLTWIAEQARSIRIWRFAESTPLEARIEAAKTATSEYETSTAPIQLGGTVAPETLLNIAEILGVATRPCSKAPASEIPLDLAVDGLRPPGKTTRQLKTWRRTALVGLAASLLLLVGLGIRARQIQSQINVVAGWEGRAWAEVFPQQSPPGTIAMRIASERKRLDALAIPRNADRTHPDALRQLCELVAAFPADTRIDLQELRIENADVIVRGRTTDHPQAERIGQAVNAIPSLDCDPVRTDRSRDAGVQFFLHAKPPASKQPQVAKGDTHE